MKTTRKVSNLIHNDVQNIVELIRLLIYVSSLMSLLEIKVVESQVSSAYNPTDNIAIDCGSSGTQVVEHRNWEGDVGSKYLLNNNSFISAAAASPTRVDSVPYSTARLSHSRFTYSIPLKPGQKFLRLYFYPSPYYERNVKISNALFSVQAGRYTLLSNFNATQTALYFGKDGFIKEFCINIDDSKILNITFIPNTSASNSFAFINGIEVVSMPTNLYHSARNGIEFIGSSYLYTINGNDTALETIYRINVGGSDISAGDDTEMFRRWDKDDDYLTNQSEGNITPLVEADFYLRFSMIKDYIAPPSVYKTARSSKERMIWEFPVDYGFNYLLRLHYCDIQIEPNSQCAFLVSVGKQNAQSITVDPTFWNRTIGKKVPIYIDSVIFLLALESGGNKRHNLSIALEASPDQLIARHSTFAILNGLEIFKLNDTSGNLAGPNPEPIQTKTPNITVDDNPFPNTNLAGPNPEPIQTSNDKSHKKLIKIGLIIGGVLVLLICGVISFFFFGRRTRKVKYFFTVETGSGTSNTRSAASSLPFQCRYFSLVEIKAVTNNFDDLSLIGVGGFGNVYKGHIDNGSCAVAIKRLKPESSQGAHEFKTEIELLSQLRHLHIVSLIGYCDQGNEMILVYDYMARGTLRDHLYLTDNLPLNWKQRLKICIGAARGLRYLHTDAKQVIIHRDVKTTNILLDDKWVAKVSDFGLSKIGSNTMSKAHVTTMVKGSIGYLDPEYYRRYQLTVKSDVYSFGVVLCEVICARPPIIQSEDEYQVSLVEWFRTYHVNGTVDQIVDQEIRGKIAPQCLEKFGEIAMNCVLDSGNERPSMIEVVCGLEFALQLQENADDEIKINDELIIERDGSSGKGKEIYSGDINTMLSELMDPKGR